MDQVVGRLDREGQEKQVDAYFLTIEDGADPFMIERLGDKRSQHEGIIEGKVSEGEFLLGDDGRERMRQMAESFLLSIGEPIPSVEPETGLQAELTAILRTAKVPSNTEKEMQEALWALLQAIPGIHFEREVRFGERSRLDFLATRGDESIAIECKIDATGKASVYRQVRRYIEEIDIAGAIIFAPWGGVPSFVIEDVPVTIADWSKAKL